MRARATLRNAETFTGLGSLSWKKGQSRDLVDAGTIGYYKSQAEFVITDFPDAPEASEPEAVKPPTFTEKELKRLKKEDLIELAAKGFGLVLDEEQTLKDMVTAVLEAQEQAAGQGG